MAEHRISIGMLRTDCSVLAAPEAAAPLRVLLDRALRLDLPGMLADALEPVLDGADGVVRIRALRLELSLTGVFEEVALARLLATRIAAALRGVLGRPREDVRVWPDAASYVASYVEARLGFERVPDWAFPEFSALVHLSPAEAAAEVVKASPDCLAELARRGRASGDAGRIVARIGAARLAPLLLAPARSGRVAARTDPVHLMRLAMILASGRTAGAQDGPVAAALRAALAALADASSDAAPALLAAARLVASLDALARAHADAYAAPMPADSITAPAAELARALPPGWIELWRRDLADPTVASTLLRCLPELSPAPERPRARLAGEVAEPGLPAPKATAVHRRITSAYAGLGLLTPLIVQHRLDRHLTPRALNRAILSTMPAEDHAALHIDALVNTLFPFDPREPVVAAPPPQADLLGLLPSTARVALEGVTGPEAWGGFLLARFADLLPGLRGSSPAYLQHQFLRRHGALETDGARITLDLPGVPLAMVLKMAGMTGPQGKVPHLADRLFVITLGGGR